ncbi:membrane protein insertion efficiency factor YidD [Pseudomonas sp. M30-35]|uniref:membrane protein insertion efficiency factor YidD n=1 Tax=Pseudomonas sp. M30-35 TaxID=1981174 RepID=UPI001C48EDCA
MISPPLGPRCRFHPSGSLYAIEAINSHCVLRGGGLVLRRLGRCHPWHPGVYAPVPPRTHLQSKTHDPQKPIWPSAGHC